MFIRLLFGNVNDFTTRYTSRRTKMNNDIRMVLENKFEEPFICYTFGLDNHKMLLDLGVDSKLVDKRPIAWDLNTMMYRHKLEAFKLGVQDYGKMVFLDWDCIPIKPVPSNFWAEQLKGSHIQACIRIYHRRKAIWRNQDLRKIPCASYLYLHKDISKELLETWEELGRPWSEEIVLARYTDNLLGGWRGLDAWAANFETKYFELANCDGGQIHDKPDRVFEHFNCHAVKSVLNAL